MVLQKVRCLLLIHPCAQISSEEYLQKKAFVLEVPKIALASLDMAFKGRGKRLKFALKVLTFFVICQLILNMHRMEWQQHGKALCFESGRVARYNLNKNFSLLQLYLN